MYTPGENRSPWMIFPVPEFPALGASIAADACVVGGGIAGVTTAYLLMKKGRRVVLLTDGALGGGMTSRTTAHLASAIDDRYFEIERLHGERGAHLAAQSHQAAIEAIEAMVAHENIDCDFTRLDGYLFLPPDGDPDELRAEHAAAVRAGVEDIEWVARAPIAGFDTGPCLRFPHQGQFHPLKYLSGLAQAFIRGGGEIHAGTHVAEVHGGERPRVVTREGHVVECADVVVATNTPISTRVAIHTKQAPYLTYVIAARVPRGSVTQALFWDTLDSYHYARLDSPGGELLIVGGEDHKTGQADDADRRFDALERWMRARFPVAGEIVHRWSGQVMETVDGLAYIGREPGEGHVFLATGDSGMGMTHGTIAGILITDLIHGAEVPWATLYEPSRRVPLRAVATYARENANAAMQLADLARGGDEDDVADIEPGTGAVMRRGLRKIAVYRDPGGTLHEMSARCTHLGCPVHWNGNEGTWDCTCHGSRYDALGHVVSGPAREDLEPAEGFAANDVRRSSQEASRSPTSRSGH
jgi:glycine/D-amino acid oxidase-like deaminating enzyme/nitrite reductase/ring-hydroxylating ferredoxin subunit